MSFLIGLLLVVAMLWLAYSLFFRYAPQIGANPAGERLDRIRQLPIYSEGKLHNPVPTSMDMPLPVMGKVIWRMFNTPKGMEPTLPIQNIKFDADAFMRTPGTVVAWFGHSSILLKVEGKVLLFDPVFSPRVSMFSFMGPKNFPFAHPMSVDQLPPIDAVLLSHDHYDHLDHAVMLQLKNKTNRFITALGVGAHLERWGVPASQIQELAWWDRITFSDSLDLVFTPSRHFTGRALNNRFTTLWGSWAMIGQSSKVYFGADSGYSPNFNEIGERLGPFDLAMLECGAYSEYWPHIHMLPEETAQAFADVNARVWMPIHWAKFNLSIHPWKEPVQRLLAAAGNNAQRVATPRIGQSWAVEGDLPQEKWWEAES